MVGVDLKSADTHVPEGDRVQLTASGSVTIWTTESEPVTGAVEMPTIERAGVALIVKMPSSRPRAATVSSEPCADTHDRGRWFCSGTLVACEGPYVTPDGSFRGPEGSGEGDDAVDVADAGVVDADQIGAVGSNLDRGVVTGDAADAGNIGGAQDSHADGDVAASDEMGAAADTCAGAASVRGSPYPKPTAGDVPD
mmetsp:Transcript_46960/g.124802  ORF Transcript_46960/g.124802 Transcript_46960/m.124802 type:complete len:196 (-) Transcript_46960:1452-2039(-)